MTGVLWPNGSDTPPPFSWQGHFGWRDADLSYASSYHRGQDFYGFSTIHAIADGEVVHVGRRSGWAGGGVMVWIQHDGFFSRSLHLADGSVRVGVGQRVTAGQAIAAMGNTNAGVAGMAVHLHLEITPGQWHSRNDGQIDPKAWLYAHVGKTIGAPAGATNEENDMTPDESEKLNRLVQDIDWLKERVGGTTQGKTPSPTFTEELAKLRAAVGDKGALTLTNFATWIKDALGGSNDRKKGYPPARVVLKALAEKLGVKVE